MVGEGGNARAEQDAVPKIPTTRPIFRRDLAAAPEIPTIGQEGSHQSRPLKFLPTTMPKACPLYDHVLALLLARNAPNRIPAEDIVQLLLRSHGRQHAAQLLR